MKKIKHLKDIKAIRFIRFCSCCLTTSFFYLLSSSLHLQLIELTIFCKSVHLRFNKEFIYDKWLWKWLWEKKRENKIAKDSTMSQKTGVRFVFVLFEIWEFYFWFRTIQTFFASFLFNEIIIPISTIRLCKLLVFFNYKRFPEILSKMMNICWISSL